MKRKIITTSDGSKTIQIEDWNEQYHSIHGAIQEANHVFLKHGLLFYSEFISESHKDCRSEHQIKHNRNSNEDSNAINILEIGFGTGLNAFLTLIETEKLKQRISYVGVEAYPVKEDEITQLNYVALISEAHKTEFKSMHQVSWEKQHQITPYFQLEKKKKFFKAIDAEDEFDIIYFDAFGARVQPKLWTEDIFAIMFKALKVNGVLVTYSAKGSVRRAMQTVGFTVERLPGPPGKREMLRACKMCL
ncbi:tRNA (5-methylaminomethyl-2-thiouridine)(34)-methyltransferase MnmD [Winogradskyella luteola]|uniref:tRNA (5-methylaminomethyl-2-thiouridine)(34)-methyltransferase MnmD n=1 Tax=Winogradskyella luteola TaxID=2828330 RepID=A0A9X1F778_9FLAO|nr:tRNA (5-methylaminomethyl-2-thiouridine)(34)-methyltransferase MnmD [Winogradskyella luteola]MBV7268474.1 tRNA (5-methylaminomethyl-2-thiouridine)(34)-methyltransferase MnmD [Winogradskyella luteola]